MPETAKPTAPARKPSTKLKVFTVEFTSTWEASIPHGWVPFAVHALPGNTPAALVYAYYRV